ncbi:MAG TPA: PhzF family phenazine biosynthesis protein [Ramlibacter sp.]
MNQSASRPFKQVDVFTPTPYRGNPVAVVLDGGGLSDEQMQRFARWTNLSETTFLLPPRSAEADYRVRIFTPGGELPFAGHPTIGSCHAWLEAGGKPRSASVIVQECEVGLVPLRRDGARLAFEAPPLRRSVPDAAVLASLLPVLGLQPQEVLAAQTLDNGPVWLGILVDQPATVLRLAPDHARLERLGQKVGLAAVYAEAPAGSPQLEVRGFAAPIGIPEDPVTGSLNASLAQWLVAEGRLPARYLAAQGARLDRAGRIHLERDEQGQVWVGGDAVTCISGNVML